MDMWPSPTSTRSRRTSKTADDKIVFDRFHIMKHMGEAVDTVRKREHRELRAEGIDTLTGTEVPVALRRGATCPASTRATFVSLKALNLKTARPGPSRSRSSVLWNYHRLGWATKFYTQWFFWATHSRLQPVIDVAYMIKRHLYGVLNYFSAARITNAAAEGLNFENPNDQEDGLRFRNSDFFLSNSVHLRRG